MGGHGYFSMTTTTGDRITYEGEQGGASCTKLHWLAFLALISAVTFICVIIAEIITYPKPGNRTEILLGLSETRIVTIRSHWFDTYEAGDAVMVDRTPISGGNYTDENFVQLMRFPQRPPLSVVDTWQSSINASIDSQDYYYWSWFFYSNSSIKLNWNFPKSAAGIGATMYFIKSEDGFDAFMEWIDVQDSSLISPYLIARVVYNAAPTFSYTTRGDDFYFVFFWNSNTQAATTLNGYFSFSIASVIFDVSNPSSLCFLPCSYEIPYTNNDVLIAVSPRAKSFVDSGHGSINTDFEFIPANRSRTWFVGLFFFAFSIGLFISLGALGSIILIISKRNKHHTHHTVALGMTKETPH